MKVGIVGGGFMGLVLAHEISKTNTKVKVFESDSQLGGLATHYDFGSFIWDKFYHVILPTDNHLINLINDIGLEESLQWRRSMTGYYVNKKFYSISSSKEFLLFPALNIFDKIKLAYTIFYGSKIKDRKKLEGISVRDWLVKMGGEKTYEKFWSPLLKAKLGDNHDRVSAVFIWTYIKRLFQARSSAAQKEHMGYVSGGYKTIFDSIQQLLNEKGSEAITNASIERIEPNPLGGITLHHNGGEEHFDKVIFTAPLNILEKVSSPDLFMLSNNKEAVEYLGVICMALITKEPLTPYYVLNIADKEVPFTGVIGMSSLVDLEQTDGSYITYFPKYITADHDYWCKSNEELEAIFLDGVRRLYPEYDMKAVQSVHMNKAFKVQPLQVLNYSDIIPKIKTKHSDFFVLNTSQFVNDTLNNNSVVNHVQSFMNDFKIELSSKPKTKIENTL
ncbi:NAD(P)/FAD-dependent oxidoreductase [Maribacter algarum]|uniref:NAD(P)/FAD-dependent oxidoreductase n=1 Tax=Maribacter algarum (ex Zhang et al. 2020) TaxID=2578118 RepID=A0A5S3PTD2_9FLAO|nr:NAD(P)/FAD-dependent oxidoreductase [Maribacter algarum]TMM58213.1 NAD(P)/FAD-dependent oxidoreductase [Maribacter algarum]